MKNKTSQELLSMSAGQLLLWVQDLQIEREGDEQDAKRYRLLRRGQQWSVVNGIGDTLREDDLDAEIDAAMLKTPND